MPRGPGAALVTLTKVDDLLLSFAVRSRDDRPCVVLDPFGLAAGLPELVWDPVAGCVDSMVAERRAKAFTAGTVKGAVAGGYGDDAARFYAAEAAKVIQAFFHAAALTGRTLDHVLRWVANPAIASEPTEILREHPHAAPYWHGLLQGALHGDDRTAGNTITTVQQAMSLFFQDDIRRRCVPGRGRPATDLADLIRRGGTIYLLGREDPYASASPLMTAVAEHVLDTALLLAGRSGWGRLCPPMLACLDELPSTAPLPTLRTRMANERALGVSFIYAAQTWRQLAAVFGEQEARALFGLTNVLVMFGGSKDGAFNQEISDLVGQTRVSRSELANRRHGRPHLLRRGHCDHPPRRDPPAAGTTRAGDRRERQTDHRPAVPLHRRKVRRPAARGPATSPRRAGRATQRRLRLRRPGPPRHWLRRDVAESPPSRSPTGDRESRKPAVGAAFPGAGKVGGVGVPGT